MVLLLDQLWLVLFYLAHTMVVRKIRSALGVWCAWRFDGHRDVDVLARQKPFRACSAIWAQIF